VGQRFTAQQGWSVKQKVTLLCLALLPVCAMFISVRAALNLCMFGLTVLFAAIVVVKSIAIVAGYLGHHTIGISAEAIAALNDEDLPVYSILLPLYKEPEVVGELMAALAELDYPKDKLDILFLLEADDSVTEAAFRLKGALVEELGAQLVIVPAGSPKTKPRACNYGLTRARGELLVIYDAEDRPEVDQLKKAVLAFRELDPGTACLQAKLNYHNFDHNLLTRLFTLEYTAWFDLYLPGLHAVGAPIPLGGTSNHFRVDVLRQLGGWDAHNVTEDCDLGIRLARSGFSTRILDSTTWEEACSEVRPWLTQRSRWVKGYLQTFLVHTRGLRDTTRELGLKATALMALTVGGLVFSLVLTLPTVALFGVWLYTYTHDPLWQPSRLMWGASISLFMFAAYFVFVHGVAIHQRRRLGLLPYTIFLPFYWAFMSVGAIRGVLQFFVKPFHWEKTPHGLSSHPRTPPPLPMSSLTSSVSVASASAPAPTSHTTKTTLRRSHNPLRIGNPGLKALWAGSIALGIAVVPYATFHEAPAGQTREEEVVVDRSWFDNTDVRVEVKMGMYQRQISSQLVVYMKVLDGEWYEHLVPAYTREGDRISFSVNLAQGWQAIGNSRPWGPWCLRRVRSFGVRVFGVVNRGLHYLDVVKVAPQGVRVAEPVEYIVARPLPRKVETNRTYEARFDVSRNWVNPFDPDVVDLTAVFETPSAPPIRVPAFYSQDYRRHVEGKEEALDAIGSPFWAVRFAASSPGHYRWHIEGKDRTGALGSSAEQEFDVEPSPLPGHARPGYVRIDPKSRRFVREPGGPFYPVGINLRSPGDKGGQFNYDFQVPSEQEGALRMEAYLNRMKAAGISMARVWLTPWFGGLEWRRDVRGYSGVGSYNLQNAWRVDSVMSKAEELGLSI
jgi:cellulose synthase/poly-beta-1,6-N-acetylglucosamine synthase-like glycosyltransferase